jgi:hypothetical protein
MKLSLDELRIFESCLKTTACVMADNYQNANNSQEYRDMLDLFNRVGCQKRKGKRRGIPPTERV